MRRYGVLVTDSRLYLISQSPTFFRVLCVASLSGSLDGEEMVLWTSKNKERNSFAFIYKKKFAVKCSG
jgi:hypothetical protein